MSQMQEAGNGHCGQRTRSRLAQRMLLLHGECGVQVGIGQGHADHEQECNSPFDDGRYFLRGDEQSPVCMRCEQRRLKA